MNYWEEKKKKRKILYKCIMYIVHNQIIKHAKILMNLQGSNFSS